MTRFDEFALPIGPAVEFEPPARPRSGAMKGRYCTLEPLALAHAEPLFDAFAEDDGRMWTYLSFGPFERVAELSALLHGVLEQGEWVGFAIRTDRGIVGAAHYMEINPRAGSVEVGAVTFSPRLQRTAAATEAMFLMADRAFEDGYRRYEWKCDSLNAASWRAAERLGFQHEGTLRNARVYKGRSRDTAYFSMLDSEWPELRPGFECWLDPSNFDPDGQQRQKLEALR
ncbi:MAG: GNAT family N-acetyltransferase [Sandaracinaceae bacterium]